MTWYYENKIYEPNEEDLRSLVGFVYCIEEKTTGMKYIGKKFFWRSKILPVTKTRKRRKKTLVESDWRNYFGSNEVLKERVIENGENIYNRVILKLCKTKGDCSYYEAKLQFEYDVLLDDKYYNSFIGCKIHSKHLTHD
jgi:hypothetical protein